MSNEIALRTSDNWLKQPEYEGIIVADPDGWPRSDGKVFMQAWYHEEIPRDEFERRLNRSTLRRSRPSKGVK